MIGTSLKRLFCRHWFDVEPPYEYEDSWGPIICLEQRTYVVKAQRRVCSKCGLSEGRRVGDPVYVGWR